MRKRQQQTLEGLGTTSSGVHYDARDPDAPWNAQTVRAEAIARAKRQQRSARWLRMSAKQKARLFSGLLTAAVVLAFALFSLVHGDRVWDLFLTPEEAVAPAATVQAIMTEVVSTPAPVQATAVAAETERAVLVDASIATVWVSGSGKRYHKTDQCSGMKSPQEVTLQGALESGYTPCKRCDPPQG